MEKQRYEVMPCSASCGHEFNATVIDTHKTSYEKDICECFDLKDAEFIAMALNRDNRIREYAAKAFGVKTKVDEHENKG